MRILLSWMMLALVMGAIGCGSTHEEVEPSGQTSQASEPWAEAAPLPEGDSVELSEAEWRERLTEEQFYVLREEGTERAFTGEYWDHHDDGVYACAACGAELYSSSDKFDSGTGWPSFTQPVVSSRVATDTDYALGIPRTEIECARCGSHLGHVFDDGPQPTGKRHCVNSVSLSFVSSE